MSGISPETFHSTNFEYFESCSQASAVEAFVKARQGLLFPLRGGLCFLESVSNHCGYYYYEREFQVSKLTTIQLYLQPAMFLPVTMIQSVDFARAGGASSTFDFHVYLKNGAIEEFSNISRHELNAIERWVNKVQLVVGIQSSSENDSEDNDEDDNDTDDEGFDPYSKSNKRQRKSSETEEKSVKGKEDVGQAEGGSNDDDDEESDYEESYEESQEGEESDDDEVELVNEEDFTVDQLKDMMDQEKET